MILKQEIKTEAYFCSVILNKAKEDDFVRLRSSIKTSILSNREFEKLKFTDFVKELNERKICVAHAKL
jgi:hypothetical protein